eukprot:1179760-Prorocentrum_minimum.AAC.3
MIAGVLGQMFATQLEIKKAGEPWEFSNPLRPFTGQLWGAIIASLILGSLAYSTCETVAAVRRDDLVRAKKSELSTKAANQSYQQDAGKRVPPCWCTASLLLFYCSRIERARLPA